MKGTQRIDIITGAAIDNIGINDPFVLGSLKFAHRCFQLFLAVILLGILQGAKGWFATRPTGEATATAPEPRRRVPVDADAHKRGEMCRRVHANDRNIKENKRD